MASSAPTIVEIELRKGTTGLGFNIRGGIDNIHLGTDPGIFVTTIKSNGAAGQDGTLQVGDKILEVNGTSLREVTHKDAVNCFQKSDDVVRMLVETGAEARIKKEQLLDSHPAEPFAPKETIQSDGGDDHHTHSFLSRPLVISMAAVSVAAVLVVVAVLVVKMRRR